jgi:hypothetical protein
MDKQNITNNTHVTSIDLLQLLFIALKLTHQIDWYWWQILTPYWITFVLLVLFAAISALTDK